MKNRRRTRSIVLALAASGSLVLAGCTGANNRQSVLNPSGSRAEAVNGLWLLMLIIGAAIWVIVVIVMVIALVHRRRKRQEQPEDNEPAPSGRGDRSRVLWFVAIVGGIVPALILAGVLVYSTIVVRETDPGLASGGPAIEVIGHQYWWEVDYPDAGVVTANEIHIPTGQRVRLQVTASDVIHSFWVPELSGKIDMIPGQSNAIWLEADKPGTYWGQCAEFCGAQHALMRFVVVAHTPQEYDGWLSAQQKPAAPPGSGEDAKVAFGRQVFLSSSCVYCHAVAGTAATGVYGPDLTHLGSRSTLAAGILRNDRTSLSRWIREPQKIKPGNFMPGTELKGEELDALLTYLESLE